MLMLSVSINQPDVEDFMDAKMEQGKVTGANVSVRMDDDFMKTIKLKKTTRKNFLLTVKIQ
jgi:ribonucleoside-diphosphate reductase alpha chain